MSFADYTALKAAIASDWLHRADQTTAIGDHIALFESDFNAEMRVRQMETETASISTAGYLLMPTNWLEWKEIRGTQGGIQYSLQPVTEEIAVIKTAGDVPPVRQYKVKGSRTYLYPAASAVTFQTTYYTGVALTTGTNWLLTAYPGAYLFGSLLYANSALADPAQKAEWRDAYETILERIRRDSKRAEYSGQVLRMIPDIRAV